MIYVVVCSAFPAKASSHLNYEVLYSLRLDEYLKEESR